MCRNFGSGDQDYESTVGTEDPEEFVNVNHQEIDFPKEKEKKKEEVIEEKAQRNSVDILDE